MKAAETRRWHGAAERLSPLRRVLAGEFKGRVLQQSLAPMAVYDRIGAPALILAVPPGSDLPCLLTDRPQPDILLDFARTDEPGTERLIGDLVVPPAGNTVYYTVDTYGSDRHLVRACELSRPAQTRTLAQGAGPTLAWDARSGTVLFTLLDDAQSPSSVHVADPAACLPGRSTPWRRRASSLTCGRAATGWPCCSPRRRTAVPGCGCSAKTTG